MSAPRTIIGNADLIFGTLELAGTVFGQVESGSIEHMGDEEGIPDSEGGWQSYLITNPQYNIQFTAIFPKTAELPTIGARVDITKLNLAANLLKWKLVYEGKRARKIEITAAHWASIGGVIGVGATVTVEGGGAGAVPPPAED
ncbi:hypothetical protein [Prosthecobacter dejongeii]|uniref:Uncharacterized protein n=1 Tax=Prosthecobacter dejongeii TaxID=48465 RepID=A0A7W7YJ54_9BACT|nr:hypothetical protein [Prosthecobacter dejongeii]MBB5037109.1 hypothetical protein [Prosthecobacter dejongeii]